MMGCFGALTCKKRCIAVSRPVYTIGNAPHLRKRLARSSKHWTAKQGLSCASNDSHSIPKPLNAARPSTSRPTDLANPW
eukprot:1702840-Pyramimonas_sp.AAC.3